MKRLWIVLLIVLLSGCMSDTEQTLTDYIAETRNAGMSSAPNQCTLFADRFLLTLEKYGVEGKKVIVSTDGKYWDHAMVKVGNYYIDNNSWFPYERGDGLFDDLHFYKFQGEENTSGIEYNR